MSSVEVECVALVHTPKNMLWLRMLLIELQSRETVQPRHPTDTIGANHQFQIQTVDKRSKHIDVR